MGFLESLTRAIEREYGFAREQSSRAALDVLQRSYEEGWSFAGRDIADVLREHPFSARRPDPNRVRHLSTYHFAAIRGVEDLAREKVRAVMKRAEEDATLTVQDVQRMLRAELHDQIEGFRLPVIARTETNRVGNAAKYDRFKATPGVTHYTVSTSEDGRVRSGPSGTPPSPADHRRLEGQVRKKGEPFQIVRVRGGPNDNGDRYPPFDPNCRCTLVPVVPDAAEAPAGVDIATLPPYTGIGEDERMRPAFVRQMESVEPEGFREVKPAFESWDRFGYGSGQTNPVWQYAAEHTGARNAVAEAHAREADFARRAGSTPPSPLPTLGPSGKRALDEYSRASQEYAERYFADSDGYITVYRGVREDLGRAARQAARSGEGLEVQPFAMESWTLNREIAESHARKGANGAVLTRRVKKEDVYLLPRFFRAKDSHDELTLYGKSTYRVAAASIKEV